jgi:hypothetical protein
MSESLVWNTEVLTIFLLFSGSQEHSELERISFYYLALQIHQIEAALHYETKLTKNIRPIDILQIYTSV